MLKKEQENSFDCYYKNFVIEYSRVIGENLTVYFDSSLKNKVLKYFNDNIIVEDAVKDFLKD